MARLKKHPYIQIKTISELVGVARAIGVEAIRRYDWLAREMRRRGQKLVAEAFDVLAAEENKHVSAVESWARGLGATAPAEDFSSRLPDDLTTEWNEASRSALLTPYRAYSLAVDNEARAFAFYTYLAASAEDARIAKEAEHLALVKLQHAATLRTWRRAAWRGERHADRRHSPTPRITSLNGLESMIAEHETEIAHCHAKLAERLRKDDSEGADLLAKLADTARDRGEVALTNNRTVKFYRADHPLALLIAAQVPLERFCEALDLVLLTAPNETIRQRAEKAMEGAVERIGQLARHAEQLEHLN
jgi:rubrerythrin